MSLLTMTTTGETATTAIGERLAACLAPGNVVALSGPLGAGKSVLARATVRALAKDPALAVQSPSFTLVQLYESRAGTPIRHVDLYRLSSPEDLVELGLEEACESAITLVEWPERAGTSLPSSRLWIGIAPGEPGERTLTFSGRKIWTARLAPLARDTA